MPSDSLRAYVAGLMAQGVPRDGATTSTLKSMALGDIAREPVEDVAEAVAAAYGPAAQTGPEPASTPEGAGSNPPKHAAEAPANAGAQTVPSGIDAARGRLELGGITGTDGAEAMRHGMEDGEPPALIDGVLAVGGKMVIAAPSKNFKSWAALELAVMCATGGAWMGRRCKPSRVVYLDYENGRRTTFNRLARVGRALLSRDGHRTIDADLMRMVGDNLTVFDMLGEGTDTDELAENVTEYIRRMDAAGNHVDLLIIDPIYKASDADENDNAEVQRALRPLDSVRRLGTATCYTSHYKKGWRTCPVEERISGAASFVRDYTAGVFLSPDADGRGSMSDASIGAWVAAHDGTPSMYDTVEHARRSEIRGYQVSFDTRDYRTPKDGTCYVEGIREGMPHHVMIPDGLAERATDEARPATDAKREQAREDWQLINAEIGRAVRSSCDTDEGGTVTRWPTAGEVYDAMDWLSVMESTSRTQPDESHFREARWLKNALCTYELDGSTGRGRRATVRPRAGAADDGSGA